KLGRIFEVQSGPEGHALVKELLQDYLNHYSSRLSFILGCFERPNLEALIHEMHCVKSSAGNLGGMKLFRLSDRIEEAARDPSGDHSSEAMKRYAAKFEAEFLSLEGEMRAICELL